MITTIVFSRDRAMQLDLLLRSMPDGFDTTVLWKATTDGHETAYLTCAREHPEAAFYMESPDGLVWRAKDILEDADVLACFLTDDSVFYRQPEIPETLRDGWLCHSFRLGLNTTWCYPHARPQTFPGGRLGSLPLPGISWRWDRGDGDFGYPASLDGHLFRAAHLRRALMTCNPQANPNRIEEHLDRWVRARLAAEFPLMTAETQSSLVGIPVNRVNETNPNRYGDLHPVSADDLCARYLNGERIAFDRMDFSDVRGAHQEIPLEFE